MLVSLVFILGCIFGLSAAEASGSTVRSEFVLNLDASLFEAPEYSLRSALVGQRTLQIPDQVLQYEIPVQLKGVHLTLDYDFVTGQEYPILGAEQFVFSRRLGGELRIDSISVDTVVERVVGSTIIRARVKADCGAVRLQLAPEKTSVSALVRAGIGRDGHLELGVPWFDLSWQTGAWTQTTVRCTGSSGFEGRLQAEIQRYMESPDLVRVEIQRHLGQLLSDVARSIEVDAFRAKSLGSGLEGLDLTLQPVRWINLPSGRFAIAGYLDFDFSKGPAFAIETVKFAQTPPAEQTQRLYLPTSILSVLQRRIQESGILSGRMRALDLPLWTQLRTYEVLVWPELQLWPKKAEFHLNLLPLEGWRLESWSNDSAGEGLRSCFYTRYQVDVLAPSEATHRRIAYLQSPFSGDVHVRASNGKIDVRIPSPFLQINAIWDSAYLPQVRFADIRTDRMQEAAVEEIKSNGFQFNLAPLVLNSHQSWQLDGLSLNGPFLELRWK